MNAEAFSFHQLLTFLDTTMPSASLIPPSLMIGIPGIDAEHALLMESLRRLHQAPSDEPRSEYFLEVISRLGQQIIRHFESEEKVIKSCGMSETDMNEHIRAHNLIIEQYTQLQDDLMSGKTLNQAAIMTMIQYWIMTHVVTHDLKIRNHIASHRVIGTSA